MGAAYFAQRTAALLLGVLAVLALALASVGLYSLVAFGVVETAAGDWRAHGARGGLD